MKSTFFFLVTQPASFQNVYTVDLTLLKRQSLLQWCLDISSLAQLISQFCVSFHPFN